MRPVILIDNEVIDDTDSFDVTIDRMTGVIYANQTDLSIPLINET